MVFDQVKESLADILSCDAEKIDMDTELVATGLDVRGGVGQGCLLM